MDATKYYRSSGQMTVQGIFYVLLLGLAGAWVGGCAYAWLTLKVPIIYANVLLVLGYGALTGYLVVKGGEWGKVRNRGFLLMMGVVFSLMAEYANWVWWVFFMFVPDHSFVLNPADIWACMQSVAEEGYWSISSGDPVKGVALYVVWGLEGLTIVGVGIGYCWKQAGARAFCEACRRYVRITARAALQEPIGNVDSARSKLEEGDFNDLLLQDPLRVKGNAFSYVSLLHCGCGENGIFLLTVENVTIEQNSKSSNVETKKPVIKNLLLHPQEYELLKTHIEEVWEADQQEPTTNDSVISNKEGDLESSENKTSAGGLPE